MDLLIGIVGDLYGHYRRYIIIGCLTAVFLVSLVWSFAHPIRIFGMENIAARLQTPRELEVAVPSEYPKALQYLATYFMLNDEDAIPEGDIKLRNLWPSMLNQLTVERFGSEYWKAGHSDDETFAWIWKSILTSPERAQRLYLLGRAQLVSAIVLAGRTESVLKEVRHVRPYFEDQISFDVLNYFHALDASPAWSDDTLRRMKELRVTYSDWWTHQFVERMRNRGPGWLPLCVWVLNDLEHDLDLARQQSLNAIGDDIQSTRVIGGDIEVPRSN